MANKKKGGGPSKTDFIRANPDLSAAEVVAKAKAAGMALSSVLVYKVRSRVKAKGGAKRGSGVAAGASGMSASAFVRSMPVSMKANDVVAAGKAKGFTLSPTLVYMVRSVERRKAGKGASGRGGRVALGVSSGSSATFKKLALDMGIAQARQALDELERGLAALLR